MAILVTGSAGFIGSSLVDRLLADGHEVIGIDNFDPYYPKEIKLRNIQQARQNPRYKFFEGDIRRDVSKLFQNVDSVFHLAAKAGVRNSIADPLGYNDVNVNGTLNLLQESIKHPVKKFVYASSSSVYGDARKLPITEDSPTEPNNPYGASKLCAEKYCLAFEKMHGLKTLSLRFFTVYGPRQRPDEAIKKFTDLISTGGKIQVFGDGSQTRDFTYIDDIVEALVLSMEKPASGTALNIGSGKRISVNDLVNLLGQTLGTKIVKEYVPMHKADMKDTLASITRARELLGYQPKTQIEEGIRRFVEWHKKAA